MEILKKMWEYLRLKRTPRDASTNLKLMHGINKISILMFVIAMIVLAVRLFG